MVIHIWHHICPTHTSECNGGIFLYLHICVYMVVCPLHVRTPCTHVCTLDTFMVVFSSDYCFATCSESRYSKYFQKSTETITRRTRYRLWHRREQEGVQCAPHVAETAEHMQKRLTKCSKRNRAGCLTLTATAWICTNLRFSSLCTYTLQTSSILGEPVMLPYATTIYHTMCLCLLHDALHSPCTV